MKICSLSYLIAIGGYKYHGIAAAAASSSSVTAEGDVVSSVTSHQVSIVVMFLPLERDIVDIVFLGWTELFVRWGCQEGTADIYAWNPLHDIELI